MSGADRPGFFIPHRHAHAARPSGYPALEPIFRAAEPQMRAILDDVAAAMAARPPYGLTPDGRFGARFDQDWFPRLDALAASAVIARARPARIVEIGSGHSTRFLADAAATAGLTTDIVCVDPQPRRPIDHLPVRRLPALLQDVGPALIADVAAGDVLFIDSSHVAMPGTDVDRLFLDLVPRLPSGALLHVHDVTLPDPYPEAWAWRGYNEQLLVGALMLGGGFRLVFSSRWTATRLRALLDDGPIASVPLPQGAIESSLWLRKT